jgi:hypothetical protein
VAGNRPRVAERMGGAADTVSGPARNRPHDRCRNPNSRVRPDGVLRTKDQLDAPRPARGTGGVLSPHIPQSGVSGMCGDKTLEKSGRIELTVPRLHSHPRHRPRLGAVESTITPGRGPLHVRGSAAIANIFPRLPTKSKGRLRPPACPRRPTSPYSGRSGQGQVVVFGRGPPVAFRRDGKAAHATTRAWRAWLDEHAAGILAAGLRPAVLRSPADWRYLLRCGCHCDGHYPNIDFRLGGCRGPS